MGSSTSVATAARSSTATVPSVRPATRWRSLTTSSDTDCCTDLPAQPPPGSRLRRK
ncbi:hypothetical protein GS429_01420 [Natronorubrum sp. JWXQ-INN-674]|uniref:Uncharacterized protein n=1 Tax=Natronorubrum halalkaliphilum TaxID=2691917 RepID=A0A6B0VG48_9EURY|nr:hypothetical protein [Natronorubrum halalkaliphilum]